MAHIHTKPGQHDHTASAFIFRIDGKEPKVVLHKHKKTGLYQQFGGHVELNETPWEAVTHEIKEESGYDINQLEVLQPKNRLRKTLGAKLHPTPVCYNTHPFDDGHSHTDVAFAMVTTEAPLGQPIEGESKEIISYSREELEKLPASKTRENIRLICLFIFDEILDNWDAVPAKYYN